MLSNAFLTGSRVYGTPREDSDLDLVVLVNDNDMTDLMKLAELTESVDGPATSDAGPDGASIRFGSLNLIAVSAAHLFELWEKGTDDLKERKPVTREDAIAHFNKLRVAAGLPEIHLEK